MNRFMKKMVFVAIFLLSFPAIGAAVDISLINQGFETNTLSGWTTTGDVFTTTGTTITTFFGSPTWQVNPNGNYMAQLNSNDISANALDAFFGLAVGTINSVVIPGNGGVTDGAGILQGFSGLVGDKVAMYWDYVARDYLDFNDTAFAVIITPSDSTVQLLSSIGSGGIAVGTSGSSNWQKFEYTLPADGNYTIGFGVVNTGDTFLDAALFLDDQAGQATHHGVPEPTTMLLLGLGLGLFGIAGVRRKLS
jgi:hypothetical protein